MFAKSTTGSARFLRMPATSRLLYYDLGMHADDDGVVEAFSVMRTTGATEDDLRVLSSKGFIVVLNEDFVAYITDWNRNNYIRPDRYNPSIHKDLLVKIRSLETDGIPNDNQVSYQRDTQVRLGKVSIGKERESTTRVGASTPPVDKYGQYGWVKLSKEQYENLVKEIGERETKRCIDYVDESAQATGNKNKWKDWNLVIRKCHRQKWGLGEKLAITPEVIPSEEPEIIDGHLVCGGKRMWEV